MCIHCIMIAFSKNGFSSTLCKITYLVYKKELFDLRHDLLSTGFKWPKDRICKVWNKVEMRLKTEHI